MADLLPTPGAVVDSDGQTQYGVFRTPFRHINMVDARRRTGPLPWPAPMRRLRVKEWQHFWVGCEDFFFGLAVVDAKYLKTSFTSFVDRRQGTVWEQSTQHPFSKVQVPRELWNEPGHFRAPGYEVELLSDLDNDRYRIRLDVASKKQSPRIEAEITLSAELATRQPLVVVLPLGKNRGMYSHKAVVPAEGEIRIDGLAYTFGADDTRCIIDIHKAHYPYRTWWRWATFWGYTTDGREVGMNLTENVAEDANRINECAVWVDGVMTRLGEADIRCEPGHYLDEWTVGTKDGSVRLTFQPEGERTEDLNYGLVKSAFHQPYGTYRGVIEVGGESLTLDRAWGVAEHHQCRW